MKVNINRQAAGLEDLLFGVGTVQQDRQGELVTITKINAGNMPFDETQSLAEAIAPINEQIVPNLPEILLADTNATIATTKAAEALVSATAAANSATAAATSATAAAASYDAFDDRYLGSKATNPTLDNDGNALLIGATYWNTTSLDYRVYNGTTWTAPATLASASATSASTSATNAATSATTATTQATNAANSATTATTQATNAANSATSASTSASIATTQVGLANTARVAAEAALDAFDDRYLGTKTSVPTLDNDGNALVSGALYFNDTLNAMYVYDLGTTTWISLKFNPTDHTTLLNIGTRTHAQLESDISGKEPTITTLPIIKGGTGTTTSTGTGSVVLNTSPTLVTPSIGVATGTSFNAITGLASVAPVAPAVTAVVGTSTAVARQDHVHPTNFTATVADIKMNGTQSVGTLTTFPRADHVHPSDTSKQATITGAATTITSSNLTASMAMVSDASGKVAAHGTVTSTELGYLDGVTSAIQTQLGTKVQKDSDTGVVYLSKGTTAQRPTLANGIVGIRYNTDLSSSEVGVGTAGATAWSLVGGGATGGGADTVFVETSYTVTQDYTITAGKSAITVGDWQGNVTIADGKYVSVPDESNWVIEGN